ncbi:ATP synthase subunit I [Bacillus manliponensis]|uniref:ATP synthase subunit I n=1 Tax=Bacillus manliponensis TaxID=574376 RepID=A0A073JQZ0_9BACI|nr:ATP synthase subunit I [Bacillus manliponensis]KEK17449.1 ATP synthase subunit I [Bacillus manliponensis]
MIRMSMRAFKIQMYYVLAILFLGWAATPFSQHFLGAGIGLLVSMYCVWILGNRIERLGESVAKKKRAPSIGMLNRFAAAILGAIVMYEIEHHMVMWAFAVGILGGYLLMIVNLAYYSMKDAKEEEERRLRDDS